MICLAKFTWASTLIERRGCLGSHPGEHLESVLWLSILSIGRRIQSKAVICCERREILLVLGTEIWRVSWAVAWAVGSEVLELLALVQGELVKPKAIVEGGITPGRVEQR